MLESEGWGGWVGRWEVLRARRNQSITEVKVLACGIGSALRTTVGDFFFYFNKQQNVQCVEKKIFDPRGKKSNNTFKKSHSEYVYNL
jgi:hypothetical protein